MLLITCPNCGPRMGSEFAWHGEPKERPDVASAGQAEWRTYLYDEENAAGWVVERWSHRTGCRTYVTVERHTVTNEIRSVRLLNAEGTS